TLDTVTGVTNRPFLEIDSSNRKLRLHEPSRLINAKQKAAMHPTAEVILFQVPADGLNLLIGPGRLLSDGIFPQSKLRMRIIAFDKISFLGFLPNHAQQFQFGERGVS